MQVVEQPRDIMSHSGTPADLTRASFVVINAPASSPPFVRPLLIVSTAKGEVYVPREPAAWANNILMYGTGKTFGPLSVIGRLYEYSSVAFEDAELTEDELPTVIWNYIAFRVGDRSPGDADAEHFSHWPPVKRATAYSEYRIIVGYVTFCHERYGTLPLLSIPIKRSKIPDLEKALDRDFFAHLSAHRARWRRLMGHEVLPKPRVTSVARRSPRRSSMGHTMPRAEIDLVISAEKNLIFKALWILLAYGGMRVSEALNLWCCDIMSGEMIGEFEPGFTQREPLVILAHPSQAKFTGRFDATSDTRSEVLRRRYGLLPRPDYPERHPMRVGWKGMLETNPALKVSWVFWSYPEPAHAFLQLTGKILNMRRNIEATKAHPYFFYNLADPASLGQPQRYSNIAKAFDRACARVGLDPHVQGRRIHGLRHSYKFSLKKAFKLSPEMIQVMMHHHSIESQRAYASTAEIHSALEHVGARMTQP